MAQERNQADPLELVRVLVVDGDPGLRDELERVLGDVGCSARARFAVESVARLEEARLWITSGLAPGSPCGIALSGEVETVHALAAQDPRLQIVLVGRELPARGDPRVAAIRQAGRLLFARQPIERDEIAQQLCVLAEKGQAARREEATLEEIRQIELEARSYAASLRTIQRALETARARSEAVSVAHGALLVNLAEKIGAPLRALRDGLEVLGQDGLTEEFRIRRARELRQRGEDLCSAFWNLAEYSRVESGTLEVVRAAVSPVAVAREVAARFAPIAEDKGLRLAVDCARLLPETVETDAQLLRQALSNVVANALRCTEQGSVRIEIELTGDASAPAPELLLHVVDTGVGVEEEERGLLFEPFRPCAGGHGEGMRLGLALSKRLCQLLGGDLGFDGGPGRGSRFTLRVPAGDLSLVRMIEHPRGPLPSVLAREPAPDAAN